MKKIIAIVGIMGLILSWLVQPPQKARAASFNPSNLISDSYFVATGAMDAGAIQRFLERQGSYLAQLSEGGRSAAQIIYDASHGHGDASGSANGIDINTTTGTVNPQVLLVTLQKEQSLISKNYRDDNALRKAMGYGCPDSGGCNSAYAGFTKQVEWAAWQFRYNYERAYGHGFGDFQVGQEFCFDDWNGTNCGRFDNRSTASLYRYTPHVYNGNYNFWNLYFNIYQFTVPEYSYQWITQNGYPTLRPGESYNFTVRVKNTGTATWAKGRVNLGTDRGQDRIPGFIREGDGPSGWISGNRVTMQQSSVAPGQNATFSFWLKVPEGKPAGTYREYFRLVADGIGWMEDYGIYWDITVRSLADQYHHRWISQNAYPTLRPGGTYNFTVTVKNTGTATWRKNRVNLGTGRDQDRTPGFIREGDGPSGWISGNRVTMQQSSVAPGQNATFSFWLKVPPDRSPGTYREYFRLVADGIGWLEDYGIYWDVTIR